MASTKHLKKIMEDNGIEDVPGYSAPNSYSIEITSPQIAQYAHLIRSLDNLMILVDTLWLNNVLTSKQRSEATYEWQQRLVNLAGKIIGMEKRACIYAHSKSINKEAGQNSPDSNGRDLDMRDSNSSDSEDDSEAEKDS